MTEDDDGPKRDKQLNLKVSPDCKVFFEAICKKLGFSKAEVFEDLVAGRLEELERRGIKLEV